MKFYCVTYISDEGESHHFGRSIKRSKKFPEMIEVTNIIKKYYKKTVPLSVLINLDSVIVIYESEETELEVITGGLCQ